MRALNLAGMTFGRLTVVRLDPVKDVRRYWLCRCRCGKEVLVRPTNLVHGKTQSCGCLGADLLATRNTTHGAYTSLEHRVWQAMKARCYNPKHKSFARYGGRGIQVCDRWRLSFAAFRSDMGPRPSPRHSIDRLDNQGNYEPHNCRWATPLQQQENRKSNSRFLTIAGETKLVVQWSKVSGVQAQTIYWRLKRGWSPETAISHPTC